MIAKLFKVECITNLHVGNGDVNYNIIDNEVERDPVTNCPTMNASGVKGAIREFFVNRHVDEDVITGIFGGASNSKTIPGAIKFLQADFLMMPVRASEGEKAFYYVTSKNLLEQLTTKTEMIENKTYFDTKTSSENQDKAKADGIALKNYVMLDGKKVYVIEDSNFRKLMLPVVARNQLDNGESKNLWYEEVVPHHSMFTFYALAEDEEKMSQFMNVINGNVVQFGGGATVGYGFCKVTAI